MADFQSSKTAQEIEEVFTGAVLFNTSSNLSEAQKAQARANIGATSYGEGIKIVSHFDTVEELKSMVAEPKPGDAYSVGLTLPYNLYIYDSLASEWKDYGAIRSADIKARFAQNKVVAVADWEEDSNVFVDYSYKAKIPIGEVTGDDFPIVAFSPFDATCGNFCPIAYCFDGYVEIWAKELPTEAISVPAITFIVQENAEGATGNNTKGITNACGGTPTGGVNTNQLANGAVTAKKLSIDAVTRRFAATIGVEWTGDIAPYTQTITVDGLPSSDRIFAMLDGADDWETSLAEEEEFNKIAKITAEEGKLIVYADDTTTVPLNIKIMVFHGSGVGGDGDMGGFFTETDPTVPDWAKTPTKPSYSKFEVGLGNVDNVKQYSANNPPPYPVTSVNGKTGAVTLEASDVGADASGTASTAVSSHNVSEAAHNDIRLMIQELATRFNAFANSDDKTLDQAAEMVAYIKANRDLIEQITTGKVNVSDIINNLTTNVSNKPLSAAQGVALKALIDALDAELGGKLASSELSNAINTALAQAKASGEFKGEKGETGAAGAAGATPVKGADYFTPTDIEEMVDAVGAEFVGLTFDTFPTEAEINALSNWDYFTTKGFYAKNDGLGSVYQVRTTASNFYVPYGNMYIRPVEVDTDHRDINVDLYGIRRGSSDYAARNSEIMNALAATLQNGFTLHFGSGQYYFATPIPHMDKHIMFKGVCTNASVAVDAVNYGSFLHFPNLADGEAAISIGGGVVQDLGIIGNPSVCNVTLDRTKSVTNRDGVVTLVDKGTTYGIKISSWGYTVQNVRIRNCTYGIYAETSNALITNVDTHQCKIGVSVGNDTKVNNIQAWNVMTGVQLRGPLASATNIRGDSIGKHLIECWSGKCTLSNIDGDYCVGSLIHYGDGTKKYIHLGQAVACMGRVATRTAYARSSSFDLRNIADADYEYCSYISIAPYTQVFGGHIELANVKANIMDSASEYVHPDAPISIGVGSTVKGVTIKCNVPYDADVEYFNKQVIKNLSTNAEAQNSTTEYVTDFDGKTVEDINFITPIGFVRSKRLLGALDRVLEFSKDANGAVLYSEQDLTEGEKSQARKNLGLDNISSLEFVASIDACTDSSKTYVLPDGRTVAFAEKLSYTNQLPLAVDNTGAIYNGGMGYVDGAYLGDDNYSDVSSVNWDAIGYIPVKTGDIVRLKNLRFLETDVNVIPANKTKAIVKFYNSSFTWVVSSANYSPAALPSAAWACVYDETGNIIQFTVPTAYNGKGIAYMRMCVRSITPDSVITVNEEILPPKTEFGETGLRFVTEDVYKKISALLG